MPISNAPLLRATEVECVVRGCRFRLRMATMAEVDDWRYRPCQVYWRGIATSVGLLVFTSGKLPVGASPEDDAAVSYEIQSAAEEAAVVLSRDAEFSPWP